MRAMAGPPIAVLRGVKLTLGATPLFDGVDLQPCGGTHVANTAEIGPIIVTKIEKKSAKTRRVVLGFAEPA